VTPPRWLRKICRTLTRAFPLSIRTSTCISASDRSFGSGSFLSAGISTPAPANAARAANNTMSATLMA
jgi:hypothetical protein